MNAATSRSELQSAQRVVIKIGSRVLVRDTGIAEPGRMEALVADIARLRRDGREVVVVTSGAIGTGMGALGLKRRPVNLPDLQMAAAVGQSLLMSQYERLFAAKEIRTGQVLLTHDDLKNRRRHLNARNTILNLLRNKIVPVINENDVVAVDEIKFGDNDLLAALVALLIEADLLVLLTTVDGFQAPGAGGRSRRVPFLSEITEDQLQHAHGKGGVVSTGGMASKLQSARLASQTGALVVIADGRKPHILPQILSGDDVGTLIAPGERNGQSLLAGRKRWIALFQRPQGTLVVDEGAQKAIETKGSSLLPIGVCGVEGGFPAGTVVQLRSTNGVLFACGLVSYSSDQIRTLMGQRTDAIERLLGARDYDEVIHRDNLVVLGVDLRGAQ